MKRTSRAVPGSSVAIWVPSISTSTGSRPAALPTVSTSPGAATAAETDVVEGGARLARDDVSFSRRPRDRVAELTYRIAGEEVGNVRCDGLVAATPVGSTGYNLANQGPILAWGVEGYVVSYIAPHSLTARALVVAT